MNAFRSCFVVLLVSLVSASIALGGGFQLNEVGARAMGMGGAFAARANDLSAMYFNPAGLAYQMGVGVSLGATAILPSTSFTNATSGKATDMVKQTFTPPHFYLGYGDKNGWAFGLAVFCPFGLGTLWPEGWEGKYIALKTDLQNFVVNPTVAYKVNDQLSFGLGISYTWSTVFMKYNIATYSQVTIPPPPLPVPSAVPGRVELRAEGSAWSFNAGMIYKPVPDLSIGISYRHSTLVSYTGSATFYDMLALSPYLRGGPGRTKIEFPNQGFAGVAYQISSDLSIEGDFQWIGWTTYKELKLEMPTGTVFPLTGKPLQGTTASKKTWANAFMGRLGVEYLLGDVSLRLGAIYDKTPQPNSTLTPELPDANRIEGTVGLGYKFAAHYSVDVAYQFIMFSDRTVTGAGGDLNVFPGTYKSTANLIALTLNYVM
jgi:long-chain fatty acid transport protein